MSQFQDLIKTSRLFDSHCHLNDKSYDTDRDKVVERAQEVGLVGIIDMGIDLESSQKAIDNAKKYEIVYASVGIDPENLIPGSDLFREDIFDLDDEAFQDQLEAWTKELEILAAFDKVAMIGETGMDDYHLQSSVEGKDKTVDSKKYKVGWKDSTVKVREKSLERQEALFRMHCKIAKKHGLPLSIHSRNAVDKCLEILADEQIATGGAVFHSLTPDVNDDQQKFAAKLGKILLNGYYVGLNAIFTFKSAFVLRDSIQDVLQKRGEDYNKLLKSDLNKLLSFLYSNGFVFETDGPFLSPAPYRGTRNEPGYIRHTLRFM